ncbi:MAG: N-acetylmuramoyl-L-alanine amidase [Clostridiales bacterium]|nr:N-acetylmuramoyl-L-alanine amidase [Clostridiales bacterium]
MKKIKRRRRRLRLSSPIGFSIACILGAAMLAGLYVGISWCVKNGPAVVSGIREAILAESATPSPEPTFTPAPEDLGTPAPQNTPVLGTPNPIPTEDPDAAPTPKPPRVVDPNAPLGGFVIGLDPYRDKNSQYKAEADYNLAFVQKLAEYLEDKGAEVVITRSNSTDVYSDGTRFAAIKNAKSDIAIRFICNHVSQKNTGGTYVQTSNANKAFAQTLVSEYSAATGLRIRKTKTGVEIKKDYLSGAGCPMVQLILGHWTNPGELAKLRDDDFQDKMIEGIYNGLLKQLTG